MPFFLAHWAIVGIVIWEETALENLE